MQHSSSCQENLSSIMPRKNGIAIRMKSTHVLCKNCGVPSSNLQNCIFCGKPIDQAKNGPQVKNAVLQTEKKEYQQKRPSNSSQFYGNRGLNEFTRYVQVKKAQTKRRRRSHAQDEVLTTECIMISDSSDDEDSTKKESSSAPPTPTMCGNGLRNELSTASEQKPTEILKIPKHSDKPEQLQMWQHHAIFVTINTILVGQMKLIPSTHLRISGMEMSVSTQDKIFTIQWTAVKCIELSPNPLEPCLYVTINPESLGHFRSSLQMHPGKFPYFDPDGPGDQKYIIFYFNKEWFEKHHQDLRTKLLYFRQMLKRLKSFFLEITVSESNSRQNEVAEASLECGITPVGEQKTPSSDLRNSSTRAPSSSSSQKSISLTFTGPRIQLAIYPSPPSTGGIPITNEDEFCLNDGEFLNDVIIDFYLKYTMEELLSKADRERSHVFSSFFYRRFSQCAQGRSRVQEDKQLSIQERRHVRVRKWTRGVDLFSKDFIFIPINDASHWYLAVICFPGNVQHDVLNIEYAKSVVKDNFIELKICNIRSLHNSPSRSTPSKKSFGNLIRSPKRQLETDRTTKKSSSNIEKNVLTCIETKNVMSSNNSEDCTNNTAESNTSIETISSQDDRNSTSAGCKESDDDVIVEVSVSSSAGNANTSQTETQPSTSACDKASSMNNYFNLSKRVKNCDVFERYKPNGIHMDLEIDKDKSKNSADPYACRTPCILMFDSLRSTSRSKTACFLREYLTEEWKYRKAAECGEKLFNSTTLKMCSPQVPQQDNYSDCGLFLLHYVEQIFKNPIKDFSIPLRSLQTWFNPEEVKSKRSKIREVIETLRKQQSSSQ